MPEDRFAARFCVGALATWRITHLLAAEDGPADAVARLRLWAGSGPAGQLLDCFYCLSVWTAAPVAAAVARRRRDTPLTWLALSGAACLLERATRERGDVDVLWTETEAGRADAGRNADTGEPRGSDRAPAQTAWR